MPLKEYHIEHPYLALSPEQNKPDRLSVVCATPEAYASLITKLCGKGVWPDTDSRDPIGLRDLKGGDPYCDLLPANTPMLQEAARYSPFPLVFCSGNLKGSETARDKHLYQSIGTNWRKDCLSGLLEIGAVPVWAPIISKDETEFRLRQAEYITANTILLQASDVLLFNPEAAGKIAQVEKKLAEAFGIPVITAIPSQNREAINEISAKHLPRTTVPNRSSNIFDILVPYVSPEEFKTIWNKYLVHDDENLPYRELVQSALKRLNFLPAWEENIKHISIFDYHEVEANIKPLPFKDTAGYDHKTFSKIYESFDNIPKEQPTTPEKERLPIAEHIRKIVQLDRQFIEWGNKIFNGLYFSGEQNPDSILKDIPKEIRGVFSKEHIDGFAFYHFLDEFYDRLLDEYGLNEEERKAVIGASHFGREYLNINRPDKTKILLINLTNENAVKNTGLEPLGAETIAGDLYGKFGTAVDVKILDNQLDDLDIIRQNALEGGYDIVGISVNMGGIRNARVILNDLSKLDKKPIAVCGARAAEFYPDTLGPVEGLEQFNVPGWGETAMSDIVRYQRDKDGNSDASSTMAAKSVRNVNRYCDGKSQTWNLTEKDMKLEHVPIDRPHPALRHNLKTYDAFAGVTVENRRGCEHKCNFCPRPASLDLTSAYPPEFKLQEIMYLSAMSVSGIPFVDEEFFNGNKEIPQSINFLKRIKEYKDKGWINPDLKFCMDLRADTIVKADKLFDEDNDGQIFGGTHPLDIMKEAGVAFVFTGIEVLSQNALNHLMKGSKLEDNLRAIELLRKHGIKFQAGCLTFTPLMEYEWLKEALENARKYDMAEFANIASKLILFANSPYYKKHFENNGENKHLLLYQNIDAEILDSSSGIPYVFKDNRVEKVATVCDFYDNEMHHIMKLLRSANAKLVYAGEENSPLYETIWTWLKYGRMDIILGGMEKIVKKIDQSDSMTNIDEEVSKIHNLMRSQKQVLLNGLRNDLTQLYSQTSTEQRKLISYDDIFTTIESELVNDN